MSRPPFGTTVPANRWDLVEPATPGTRTVSVVVTHYDQPDQLARTLAALDRQTDPPHEVVVADDGSPTPPAVPPGVRLVRQEDRGFRAAAARNHGTAATGGEVLVFLDADTSPEPAFLREIAALPSALPELVAVGRRCHADLTGVDPGAPVEWAGRAHALPAPGWLAEAYERSGDLLLADAGSHRFVIGAVLACTRWWFDEVGGFDDSFGSYGGEDWEFAHRSWLAGGLVAHRPAAVAWHDGPDAGAAPRTADDGFAESVAVADRCAAPHTGWRGLLRGPPPLAVTCAPSLSPAELLATLDSLLAALPRTHLLLDDEQRRVVGPDPRVGSGPAAEARLHLHLEHGVLGDVDDWRGLVASLDGPEGWGTREVGPGAGVLHDLRLRRRAQRWGRDDLAPTHPEPWTALRPWRGQSLEAWLGGWA